MKATNVSTRMALLLTVMLMLMFTILPAVALALEPGILPGATGYIGSGSANAKISMYDKALKGKKTDSIAKGETFNVRQIWGNRLLVDKANLEQGFIAADKSNIDFDVQYAFLLTRNADVYSEAKAAKKSCLLSLKKGDEVTLLGLRGQWALVLINDQEGYMLYKYLKMKPLDS